MKQWAILRRMVVVVVVIGLLMAITIQPARAVPVLPSDFWGYVTLDGSPVASGTVVKATVNGVSFQTTTSSSGGQALYVLSVNGDDLATGAVEGGTENQAVAFQVGGVTVAQTGVWRTGSNVQLNLARVSTPAAITAVTPSSAARGATANVTVVGSGANFAAGVTQVSFGVGVTVNSVSVTSKTQLTANITVAANAAPGSRTVTATTGGEVATKANGFSVLTTALDVFLPVNSSGPVGAEVSIPITIPTNYTGRTIIAYSLRVTADPAVLQFTGIDKAGTLSSGWTVEERHDIAGEIGVVAYGATSLGSNGVLLNLRGRVTGSNGAATALQFASITFNEGTPTAIPQNGRFTSSGLAITGRVTYAAGSLPVSSTVLTLAGGATMTATSGVDGVYRLPVTAGKNYTVTPSNSRYSGSAISALDAARVAQCILGIRPATDCPLNAADTNNSKSVTAYDASVIARYAVGLTSPSSLIGNWAYEPANRSYTNVQASQLSQNYQAFVRGDVTANWSAATAAAEPAAVMPAAVPIARLLAPPALNGDGQLVAPLRLAGPLPPDIVAYQFELRFDPALLQLVALDPQGTLSNDWEVIWNEESPGHVLVAAFAAQPLAGEGDLLRLIFTTTATDTAAALAALTVSSLSLNEDAAQIEVTTDYGDLLNQRLYLPAVSSAP
jgi:hypothetical protein